LGDGGRRRYAVQAALTVRPCAVRIGKRVLPHRAWRYDKATTVLRASVRTKRARLTVTPCRG
jgi:hypothetical protein